MRTIKDASFGIVPVRVVDGVWQVLLIHQISNMQGDSYWILPKGHQEKTETPVTTALRELHEETGLVPNQVDTDHAFELAYSFRYEGDRIEKTVTFYIGHIAVDAPLHLQTSEVKEAGWYDEHEAYERITHKNARSLLRKVFTHLKKSNLQR